MGQIELNEAEELEFQKQWSALNFGVSEITPEDEFKKMLRHSIKSKTPLRVKCGIDPTSTDVHLGHTVPYRKMRQFQDFGHIGVVIIGDYTASIGDPTGKNESRPPLDEAQVKLNAKKYMDQIYTVLDPEKTEVCYQSEWFSEVSLKDVLQWAGQTTVAKLLGHDTFKSRLDEGNSLALHELFYPVLQGIDSVYINADVELGGTDQRFNVLMGRDYQKNIGKRPQVAMLLPIITGTCGSQKMSKSLNNYIGILDEPFDKFGKVMSIPDSLMAEYFKYASGLKHEKIESIIEDIDNNKVHPNEAKKHLAHVVVSFFHGEETAIKMREQFENVFKKKQIPDEVPEFTLEGDLSILDLMTKANLVSSKKEARRMIDQGGVSFVDKDKVQDVNLIVNNEYKNATLKVGKRKFLKLV
ncbi:MAG: tyrosine--tRNA ligase [Halobacteriovoraceae bacterium]|nr:tyrosine--tRNA ligase [Halobacteriovoraceae bacterium]